MAALSEDGSYGLNCGQQNAGKVTVLHVKLTETALKAIESHQKCSVSENSGRFNLKKKKKRNRTSFGRLTQLVSAGKLGCHAQVKATKLALLPTGCFHPRLLGSNTPSSPIWSAEF